jgi:hypothetical protein
MVEPRDDAAGDGGRPRSQIRSGSSACQDDVGLQADQLLSERSYPIDVTGQPEVHPQVAAIGPTQVRKRLRERRDAKLPLRIVFVAPHKHADAPYAVALLRARRQRPCRRRAADKRDEQLAPPDAEHGLPPRQT